MELVWNPTCSLTLPVLKVLRYHEAYILAMCLALTMPFCLDFSPISRKPLFSLSLLPLHLAVLFLFRVLNEIAVVQLIRDYQRFDR